MEWVWHPQAHPIDNEPETEINRVGGPLDVKRGTVSHTQSAVCGSPSRERVGKQEIPNVAY